MANATPYGESSAMQEGFRTEACGVRAGELLTVDSGLMTSKTSGGGARMLLRRQHKLQLVVQGVQTRSI